MYKLSELLPHQNPMLLLNEVVDYSLSDRTLTAKVVVSSDSLFFDKKINGVSAEISLEYMAQTIGCMAGIYDLSKNPEQPPKVGFVLGSRRIENFISVFECGKTYLVKIKELFFDENLASFDCVIYDDMQQVVSTAVLNAYRPDSIEKFMEELHE